jgi:tRNA(Ile)-lysidine synthase
VRGGGRASSDGLALDVIRLAQIAPALQRRLLRSAAAELDAPIDFPATETLRALALHGKAGQKRELARGLRAERTPRELRLSILPVTQAGAASAAEHSVPIPGEVTAFGLRLRIEADSSLAADDRAATLRNWKPGDRVQLRYSSGPRKVKEVLERLKVTGSRRALWPVVEIEGRIAWMQGVEVEPVPGIRIETSLLENDSSAPPQIED